MSTKKIVKARLGHSREHHKYYKQGLRYISSLRVRSIKARASSTRGSASNSQQLGAKNILALGWTLHEVSVIIFITVSARNNQDRKRDGFNQAVKGKRQDEDHRVSQSIKSITIVTIQSRPLAAASSHQRTDEQRGTRSCPSEGRSVFGR